MSLYTLASSSLFLPFFGPALMTVIAARRWAAALLLLRLHTRTGASDSQSVCRD